MQNQFQKGDILEVDPSCDMNSNPIFPWLDPMFRYTVAQAIGVDVYLEPNHKCVNPLHGYAAERFGLFSRPSVPALTPMANYPNASPVPSVRSAFQPGDKIRCLDNAYFEQTLTVGNAYTFESYDARYGSTQLFVKEVPNQSFSNSRFESIYAPHTMPVQHPAHSMTVNHIEGLNDPPTVSTAKCTSCGKEKVWYTPFRGERERVCPACPKG